MPYIKVSTALLSLFLTCILIIISFKLDNDRSILDYALELNDADTRQFIEIIGEDLGVTIIADKEIDLGKVTNKTFKSYTRDEYFEYVKGVFQSKGYKLTPTDATDTFVVEKLTQDDALVRILKASGVGYAVLNIFCFFLLILMSRWSHHALAILTNQHIGRIGIYFHFAVAQIRSIQLWVFSKPYTKNQAIESENFRNYVDLTATCENVSIPSSKITHLLKQNRLLWLQGTSGTGKSETLKQITRQFYNDKGIFRAWYKHRYIPLYIPLREFSDKTPLEAIQISLSAIGLQIDNPKIIKQICQSNLFLFLFDGMNEVDLEKLAWQFIKENGPNTRAIITSQLAPQNTEMHTVILHKPDMHVARKIICGNLDEKHKKTFNSEYQDIALLKLINSAYECLLISKIIMKNKPLPSSMQALYNAQLEEASLECKRNYGYVIPRNIYKLSLDMWLQNGRRFQCSDMLTEEVARILLNIGILSLRNHKFEFSHDLMRAFFVAKELIEVIKYPAELEELFNKREFWNRPNLELDLVFEFMMQNQQSVDNLVMLMELAQEDVENRVRLVIAISDYARNKGLNIVFA